MWFPVTGAVHCHCELGIRVKSSSSAVLDPLGRYCPTVCNLVSHDSGQSHQRTRQLPAGVPMCFKVNTPPDWVVLLITGVGHAALWSLHRPSPKPGSASSVAVQQVYCLHTPCRATTAIVRPRSACTAARSLQSQRSTSWRYHTVALPFVPRGPSSRCLRCCSRSCSAVRRSAAKRT